MPSCINYILGNCHSLGNHAWASDTRATSHDESLDSAATAMMFCVQGAGLCIFLSTKLKLCLSFVMLRATFVVIEVVFLHKNTTSQIFQEIAEINVVSLWSKTRQGQKEMRRLFACHHSSHSQFLEEQMSTSQVNVAAEVSQEYLPHQERCATRYHVHTQYSIDPSNQQVVWPESWIPVSHRYQNGRSWPSRAGPSACSGPIFV